MDNNSIAIEIENEIKLSDEEIIKEQNALIESQSIMAPEAFESKRNEYEKKVQKYNNCIIEGRDISTEIIPYSDVKFYFICDLENASKRRYQDLKKKNHKVKLSEVKKSIKLRNLRDKNRKHSPLLKHRDALEIHTGKLNRKKMVEKMSKHIEDVMNT